MNCESESDHQKLGEFLDLANHPNWRTHWTLGMQPLKKRNFTTKSPKMVLGGWECGFRCYTSIGICFMGDYGLIGSKELVQHDSVLIEWPLGWNCNHCNLLWLFVFSLKLILTHSRMLRLWMRSTVDDWLRRVAKWLGTIFCRAT